MGELEDQKQPTPATAETSGDVRTPPPSESRAGPPPRFDPTRMIGIIKRKALIKDLAAVYHTECLTHCQELLELQTKRDDPYIEIKTPKNLRKETMRPGKRVKKSR